MTTFFENVTARPVLAPTSAANLRTEPSAKYISGLAALVAVGTNLGEFAWDPASVDVDDGVYVIKPTDILPANPGRFIRMLGDVNLVASRTLFVDGGYTGVVTDGSLNAPYKTISAAIAAVPAVSAANGVEIWQILVAPRSYAESLTIPVNRQIVLAPWKSPRNQLSAVPLGSPAITGDVTWVISGGVAGTSSFSLQNFFIDQFFIDATVAPVSTVVGEIVNCIGNTVSMSAGTFPATGVIYLERTQFFGAFNVPTANVVSRESDLLTAFTCGTLLDYVSKFSGAITCATVGSKVMQFVATRFGVGASFVNANADIIFDAIAARNAANAGILNTPASGVANLWRSGVAGYYSAQHTVRYSTANVAANLGDEYIAMDPAAATTITVTLPAAAVFADAANETNGAVARRPTRHLIVRNVAASGGTGIVAFATLGTDDIDRAAATGFILLAGEFVLLVPVLIGAVWSWMPLQRDARNYFSALVLARTTTSSVAYVTKTTLTTPALRGTYRVGWSSVIDQALTSDETFVRLQNTTDAVTVGVERIEEMQDPVNRIPAGGFGEVTFTGAAKTFEIQFHTTTGAGTAGIQDARIELWRVF